MDLILWRHAEALDGGPDLERALTGKGHKQARHVAEWLQQRLPSRYQVLSSPARRARETAEALGMRTQIVDALAPGASVHDVLEASGWPDHRGVVIVVGHQPTLGSVCAFLVHGESGDLSIRKGAVWWLTTRSRDGESQVIVRAVIAPDLV